MTDPKPEREPHDWEEGYCNKCGVDFTSWRDTQPCVPVQMQTRPKPEREPLSAEERLVREALEPYEFNAQTHGDRMSVKLSVDQCVETLSWRIRHACEEARREERETIEALCEIAKVAGLSAGRRQALRDAAGVDPLSVACKTDDGGGCGAERGFPCMQPVATGEPQNPYRKVRIHPHPMRTRAAILALVEEEK